MLRTLFALALLSLTAACATSGPLRIGCTDFESKYRVKLASTGLEQDIQQGTQQALFEAAEPNPLIAEFDQIFSADKGHGMVEEKPAVLLLSGGGQWGAFGAGYLKALHDGGKLPDFQIITGVSTGGLQSLFLAVASDEAFDQLLTSYSPHKESEIVNRGPQALAAVTGAMAGLKPLKRRIEQKICPDLSKPCFIDQLKKLDKKVLIGFVGAETGDFYFADAVKLAAIPDKAMARQCLTAVALASAAMPVFFQQVRINKKTYYDGGVRQSVFEDRAVEAAHLIGEKRRAELQGEPLPIYVVRNGPTTVRPDKKPDKKANALTGALRAEAIVVNQLEVGSIAALRLQHPTGPINLITADGWGGEGPEGGHCVKPDDIMFDPAFMTCLRAYGAAKAGKDPAWWPLRDLKDLVPPGQPGSGGTP